MLRLMIRSLRDRRSRVVSWIEMVLPGLLFHVVLQRKGLPQYLKRAKSAKPLRVSAFADCVATGGTSERNLP